MPYATKPKSFPLHKGSGRYKGNLHDDCALALSLILQPPPPDTVQVIEPFAPSDFLELLSTLEKESHRPPVKLIYVDEDQVLLVITPSHIHEGFLISIKDVVGDFVRTLRHDHDQDSLVSLVVHSNTPLRYLKVDETVGKTIPDFILALENRAILAPLKPKWIGEVAFTASTSATRARLAQVVNSQATVDLAFLLRIEEAPKWERPKCDPSQPPLSFQEFAAAEVSAVGQDAGGSIVLAGIPWMSVARVTLELYVRRPSGHLTVDDKYAVVGTLYPAIDTEDVDQVFHEASQSIKACLITEMEASNVDGQAIEHVQQSEAQLVVPWEAIMVYIRERMLLTAHERYLDWHGTM